MRILQRTENQPPAKNWAIPQASYEWICCLMQDEWFSPALQKSCNLIKMAKEPVEVGFWMYRANHFLGKRVSYSGWQGDKVIRLFEKTGRLSLQEKARTR